jgi:hypothetical protein
MIYILIAENYPIAVHAVAFQLKPSGLMQEQDIWASLNSMELSSLEPLNNIKGFFVGQWWKNQTNIDRIPILRAALLDRGNHVQLMAFDLAVARGLEENHFGASKALGTTANLGIYPTMAAPRNGAMVYDPQKNLTYVWNGSLWELQP